jgi:hypothetical protein
MLKLWGCRRRNAMRVFVLGGYGTWGRTAIPVLAGSDLISEIALAGRNPDRAAPIAAEIGDKATVVQVDGTDEEQLASAVADYDIILNIATNKAVLPGIRAAIRAGVHYCDVSFGPIMDEALQLNAEAKNAGVTAILGNGVSPSITNLMGVHAARHLDEVEQLQGGRSLMFWGTRVLTFDRWLADPVENLAFLQEIRPFIEWMLPMTEEAPTPPVRSYERGQWVDIDAIQSGIDIPLPQGGTITRYPYKTLPPVLGSILSDTPTAGGSLPRDLGNVSPVDAWFGPFPPQLHDLLREQALSVIAGEIDAETAVRVLFEAVESDPGRWLTLADDFAPFSLDSVTAVGRKTGRAARYDCWLVPDVCTERNWWSLTSVPMVVAALRILRGEVRERGVMIAETTFEPMPFFDEVAGLLPDPPPNGRLIGESLQWLE